MIGRRLPFALISFGKEDRTASSDSVVAAAYLVKLPLRHLIDITISCSGIYLAGAPGKGGIST